MIGLSMRATTRDEQLVCIALVADQELIAEVRDDDPLFAQIEKLAKRFTDALGAQPTVTWQPAGSTAPQKSWRTDTSKSDSIWREAFRLIYDQRCATSTREDHP